MGHTCLLRCSDPSGSKDPCNTCPHSPQVQEFSASLLIQADGGAGRLRGAGVPAVIFRIRGERKQLKRCFACLLLLPMWGGRHFVT